MQDGSVLCIEVEKECGGLWDLGTSYDDYYAPVYTHKSAEGDGKMIFGATVALDGGSPKMSKLCP